MLISEIKIIRWLSRKRASCGTGCGNSRRYGLDHAR